MSKELFLLGVKGSDVESEYKPLGRVSWGALRAYGIDLKGCPSCHNSDKAVVCAKSKEEAPNFMLSYLKCMNCFIYHIVAKSDDITPLTSNN